MKEVKAVVMHAAQTGAVGTGQVKEQSLLRLALKLDGAVSGAVAVLSLLGARPMDGLLGLPAWLHWAQGGFLAVYAAALWYAATRPRVIRWIAVGAVVLNVVWAVGCLALATAGWFPVTDLGTLYIGFIGIAVVVFAALQVAGLRRAAG
ncbi:hypothetical protein [Streptomyces coffeae]|uniref:Uncharacterized protein n=1 Tax=Streptomyces coffeae TaxID=621382 RepID=A0ABS1NDG1_9ACTN|nr:hypothetical protein [Streptomyces coffeae]MBL1097930.1 hypothetical protein [Streptomyces coffeae]